jgi:hypothetical protein
MAGSVFFIALVVVVVLVVVGIGTPFLLIPVVLIGLGLLLVPMVMGALRGTAVGEPEAGSPGVPTTREASYDPVREP